MSKSKVIASFNQFNSQNKRLKVKVTFSPSKARINRAPFAVRVRGQAPEYKHTEEEAIRRARQILEVFTGGSTAFESGTLRAAVDLYQKRIKEEYDEGCIVWGHYRDNAARARAFVDVKERIVKDKFKDLDSRHWRCRKEGYYEKDIHGKYLNNYTPRVVNGNIVGQLKTADLTKDDCKDLLKEFSHRSDSTQNEYKLTLIAVLDIAKEEKWCLENAARNIKNKRKKYGQTEQEIEDAPLAPFPPHKIAAVIKAAEDAEQSYGNITWCFALALLFLCRTGLRFGELAALKWKSIEFHNKRILVRTAIRKDQHGVVVGAPKDTSKDTRRNHKERVIPIGSSLISKLQEWKLRSPCSDDEDRVFITPKLEMLTSSWHLRQNVLRAACRTVGFKPYPDRELRLHELRHVYASNCFDFYGENYNKVAELLGHAKIDTTRDIYSHWFDDVERDIVDADGMEAAWERRSQQVG